MAAKAAVRRYPTCGELSAIVARRTQMAGRLILAMAVQRLTA
jgi:hypothetical protein